MDKAPLLVAMATVLAGTWLLLKGMQQQGSGGGDITTENTMEGTLMDQNGIANQVASAFTPTPAGNPFQMSAQGLEQLKTREGFSANKYPDHKGYSVGFGHLIKPGESLDYVSVAQATDLLMQDVAWAESSVYKAITVPIAQVQFDALVSFCYNVGAPSFERSTLVRKINSGDDTAPAEFDRWVYASGARNGALVARRASERQQFESATA